MERWIPAAWSLLCVVLSGVGAIHVTIPQPEYEFARGDNITLPCSFTTSVKPLQLVIITWSIEGLQANAKENVIFTHYHSIKKTDIGAAYQGRVTAEVDVPKGKANLKMKSITLADNKMFECQVQIPGDNEGKPSAAARLVVLVAPSTPICKVQGKAEYGQNINVTCHSEEGSPPPEYTWEVFDVQNQPRQQLPGVSNRGAIKPLLNISRETSGFYVCTSKNKIRSATCNVTLAVLPPSMNIGSTAGIIAGVVAALIALIVIIYCCCCRKKKEEKEYAMGVRQDEYHDKEADVNDEDRRPEKESAQNYENSEVRSAGDRRDQYEDKNERDYDRDRDYGDRDRDYGDRDRDYGDRGRDYDDRGRDYDDRGRDYEDRGRDYEDRGRDYDDRGRDYEDRDRRSNYDDRSSDYDNRRERYDDDRRYEDERRYNERRDDDRY